MKARYVAATTLIALAAFYLGCTNPSSLDPRVQAGNATGTDSNETSSQAFTKDKATGYWFLERLPSGNDNNGKGHLAIRQLSDGKLIGENTLSGTTVPLSGTNSNGALTINFILPGGVNTPTSFSGAIADDGLTVTLTKDGGGEEYKATRLF